MMQTRLGTKQDITGILSLQDRNLFSNLNEQERSKGFVTTPFTVVQIEKIIKQNGLFVATNKENKIISYAFAGS